MSVVEKIKLEMRRKKITAPELSASTNIPLMTIQNIMQRRSKKPEHLEKIAFALNVTLEYLTNEDAGIAQSEICLRKYGEAVKIGLHSLENKNLKITKPYLEDFIHTIYLYIIQDQLDPDSYVAYAEGLLQRDIAFHRVNSHANKSNC